LVVPLVAPRVPQAPEGVAAVVRVTESPDTATEAGLSTVTVTAEVDTPFATMEVGLGTTVTVLLLVWVIVVLPLRAASDSLAVTVQVPPVVLELYVITTWPDALVVPLVGLSCALVHTAAGDPETVKFTVSPDTAVPVLDTVTVIVEAAEAPAAGTEDGLADTVIDVGVTRLIWSMLVAPV